MKKINEIFSFEKGSLQSTKSIPGNYNFITASEEWKTHTSFTHECEALVFASSASGSLGRTHYINGKFIASDLCYILTPKKKEKVDLVFYWFVFSFLKEDIVKKTSTGTSKLAINSKNFGNYELPYFDYKYQEKNKEKLLTIDKLKNKLNYNLEKEINFLKQLRQAILQEAVEGKPTADWRKKHPELISGENSTENLLKKIKKEKEQLIKEKKIKKEKPLSPISEEEKPFKIPDTWVYSRLGDLGFINPRNYINNNLIISFVPMKSISEKYGVSPDYEEKIWNEVKSGYTHFANKDIAIAKITPCFENSKCCIFRNLRNGYGAGTTELHVLRPIRNIVNSEYVYLFLKTPRFLKKGESLMKGTAGQKRVPLNYFSESLIPLPPIPEQQVIVNRISNFMNIVDELEKQINTREEQTAQLVHSVLRETFEQK